MNVRTLACAAALAVSSLLPIAAHAQEDLCAGVVEYANEVATAIAPFVEANGAIDFGGVRDITTISTAEWKQLGDTAAASMFALTDISPPPALAEFHQKNARLLHADDVYRLCR